VNGGGPHFPDHRKNERGNPKRKKKYSLHEDLPKVVLLTDEQLDDIANLCCNDNDGHSQSFMQMSPFSWARFSFL